MKLHLFLLASLFRLSRGFMAELTGPLTLVYCVGDEYADFKTCVDEGLQEAVLNITGIEQEAFIHHGRDRELQNNNCSGCTGGAPRGTFCFTVCGGRRRLAEKTGLRRLQTPSEANFVNGSLVSSSGSDAAIVIGTTMFDCMATHSVEHPCLGSTSSMNLTVTV
jgi:hypothetical protein